MTRFLSWITASTTIRVRLMQDMHGVDPDDLDLVDLYDVAWEILVEGIPDTPKGRAARADLLAQLDVEPGAAEKVQKMQRDLSVAGIDLAALVKASGKRIHLAGLPADGESEQPVEDG